MLLSMTRSVGGFRASARVLPPTKELFLTILMHMMSRVLIPGIKQRVRWCQVLTVTVGDVMVSSVNVLAAPT